MTRTCPICNKEIPMDSAEKKLPKYYPFCSNRCKMVDLGGWFDEGYRVAGDSDEEEILEDS